MTLPAQAEIIIVGGGIANFTDVAATFKGIIQVRRTVAAWPGLAPEDVEK